MQNKVNKDKIFRAASRIVIRDGYEKSSMRQIADECGISLGGLCHYYKKKEYLLMDLHSETMDLFYDLYKKQDLQIDDPWTEYVAVHYSCMRWVISSPSVTELYMEYTKMPSLRNLYAKEVNELLQRTVDLDAFRIDKWDAYVSCLLLSGAQFEDMYVYNQAPNERSIDSLLFSSYKAQLFLLGVPANDIENIIDRGFSAGRELLKGIKPKMDEIFGIE